MALSADRPNTAMRNGELFAAPAAAGTKIFAGAIVAADASGYAVPGKSAPGLAFLGRAETRIDNSNGAAGDKQALVRRGPSFFWKNSAANPVTQADLGRLCYIEDDETVARASGGGARSAAGVVLGVQNASDQDGAGVWIAAAAEQPRPFTLSAAVDFPPVAARSHADKEITAPGAPVGAAAALGLPAAPQTGLVFQAFVSAAGKVKIRAHNYTASPVNPPNGTYAVTIFPM